MSGGGESNTGNNTSTITTPVIPLPSDLTIVKVANGTFTQGQTGATYTLTVTNAGTGPTSAAVSVTDTLPVGLTATAIAGTGWTCVLATLTCTRGDVLAPAASYPPITLTVNIAANAPANVVNIATVSGGGETNTGNNTSTVTTPVAPLLADLMIVKVANGTFTQGQTGADIFAHGHELGRGTNQRGRYCHRHASGRADRDGDGGDRVDVCVGHPDVYSGRCSGARGELSADYVDGEYRGDCAGECRQYWDGQRRRRDEHR